MNQKMRILIPLDGSPTGETILEAITPLLKPGLTEPTLLHVQESAPLRGVPERLQALKGELEQKGIPTRVLVTEGESVGEILQQAKTGGFDLIAMATHGRSGLRRVEMGSVAEEIMWTSPVPTLLCKPGIPRDCWQQIVVALDGTPGAEEVLGDVVRLARMLGARVHLVQVALSLLWSDGYRSSGWTFQPPERHGYLEGVATRLRAEGIEVDFECCEGQAATNIQMVAQDHGAGLICMTTRGRPSELPGADRSVSAGVLRHAPCAVYVRRMSSVPAIHT